MLGKERNGCVRGVGSGVTPMLMNLEALRKSHTYLAQPADKALPQPTEGVAAPTAHKSSETDAGPSAGAF